MRSARRQPGFALDGEKWDGIYFGRRKGSDLTYAGKVDYGFDKKSSAELRKRLTPLIRKTNPTPSGSRKGIWVEPELSAEIEYRAKSAQGKMRHPFFIKVYARISPLGTGADFRRWFFVRHARRLTHWNGGPSVLSPRLGPFFRCHQVCRGESPPSLLSRTTGRFMKKPQREFDRDEIVVCMVLTVCIGNAVISTIYRMLG